MKIKEVAATLEQFAPLPLQESYDNAGLQIGLTADEDASGVLLCLDVTEEIVAEAEHKGCNMIVAHHPLIFRPLYHITSQTMVERCVARAIQKGISIYAAHTNLDNAEGGVNFEIAEHLCLHNVRFLKPNEDGKGGSGLIGKRNEAISTQLLIEQIAKEFGVKSLLHNNCRKKEIRTVALCGGAGDFLLDEAIRQGADAFLTGEMGYHRYFGHEDEILICVIGHYESEHFTINLLQKILRNACPHLRIELTEINTNPIIIN